MMSMELILPTSRLMIVSLCDVGPFTARKMSTDENDWQQKRNHDIISVV